MPPLRLEAVELRDELAGGLTKPLLAVAIDDSETEFNIVLKPRVPDVNDGHMGATSLACELICSVLARSLGLPVPDYAIVNVSAEFVASIVEPRARALLAANLGENFGSIYHKAYLLWNPADKLSAPEVLSVLEDLIVFDATVINGDRRREKPNLLWNGEGFMAIDHSLALPMALWDDATIDSSPLFPDVNIQNHAAFRALQNRRSSFVDLLSRWQVDAPEVAALRALIPLAWERNTGDVDKIMKFLVERHAKRGAEIAPSLARVVR